MSLARELTERGFVYQYSTETLEEILDGKKRTVYLGIDPTADSMHVGHLVPYMMLNHILRDGHMVIVLMGGGTALIGDPSFKESERDIASIEEIKKQCEGLEQSVRAITTSGEVEFVNNYDWLSKLNAIEFLRDVGKHFTVNAMVKRESVAARMESTEGISYTEFSYALLQSYDYYHLHRERGCDLQIGGSDQWGNIISGVDFVRRKTGDEVYALTMPLIIDKASGKKFGKSEGNAVWLDPEKTPPYDFYQFWFNTSDENVIEYLKLFTLLPLEEIGKIKKEFDQNPGSRSAQKQLARVVTTFVHAESVCELVENVTDMLFGDSSQQKLSEEELEILFKNAPTIEVVEGDMVIDVLAKSELATSKREARTFIESGAVSMNGEKVTSVESIVGPAQSDRTFKILKRGKKQLCVLKYR